MIELVELYNGIFTSCLCRVKPFQIKLGTAMLRPRALSALLGQVTLIKVQSLKGLKMKSPLQANTDGVESTFLFKQDGTLLAHASTPQTSKDPRVMSAIASNIWAIYDKSGRASLNEDSLEMLMLDCEEGRLALVPVNTVLLAVLGDRNVGPGMLRYSFRYTYRVVFLTVPP